jgi:S1-C subfamily serine protease
MKPSLFPLAAALLLAACAPATAQRAAASSPSDGAPTRRMAAADLGFSIHVVVAAGAAGLETVDYPVVDAVRAGSPAERVGLRADDVILAIDGRDAREPRMFRDLTPGRKYLLHVRRGGDTLDLEVEAVARQVRPGAPGS